MTSTLAATLNFTGGSASTSDVTYLAVPVRLAASPTLPHRQNSQIPDPTLLPTLNEEIIKVDEIPAPTFDAVTQTTASLDSLPTAKENSCDNSVNLTVDAKNTVEAKNIAVDAKNHTVEALNNITVEAQVSKEDVADVRESEIEVMILRNRVAH